MNTVLFVNATIGFSENLFLVYYLALSLRLLGLTRPLCDYYFIMDFTRPLCILLENYGIN